MHEPVVIIDTVVFVRALLNPHSHWGRLVFEYHRIYRLIVTPLIVREYVEVLQRPELTSRFSTLKTVNTHRILEIIQKAEVVHPQQEPQVSRDIKNNKFLAAAAAAKAHYIISEDRDLLGLDEHQDTRIVRAYQFLERLKKEREAA